MSSIITTSSAEAATTNYRVSDVYEKCPFCKEEMYYKGILSPSLRQLKVEHAKVCDRYARWRAANKGNEEIEQEKEKLQLDGKQMAEAQIRFMLYELYEKIRLEKQLNDPSISSEEKRFKISGELREAEANLEHHVSKIVGLLNNEKENEHVRLGAREEWDRCQSMKNMAERRRAYRL
jgi:hypothetical protein